MQILGGAGYLRGNPVERHEADVMAVCGVFAAGISEADEKDHETGPGCSGVPVLAEQAALVQQGEPGLVPRT